MPELLTLGDAVKCAARRTTVAACDGTWFVSAFTCCQNQSARCWIQAVSDLIGRLVLNVYSFIVAHGMHYASGLLVWPILLPSLCMCEAHLQTLSQPPAQEAGSSSDVSFVGSMN